MIKRALRPQQSISEAELNTGLKMLLYDGIASQMMGTLTGGAFLVAFALLNGASNFTIGLIAAIGPFSQILQIPAVWLVEKVQHRKLLVVLHSIISRMFWVVIAVTPWIAPQKLRIPIIFGSLFIYFGLGAISGCAFNSWIRDLMPENIMGRYFSKRMTIAAATGAALSIAAGFGLDYYKAHVGPEIQAYSFMMAFGGLAGLIGALFLSRIPEPYLKVDKSISLIKVLISPFYDANFRKLLFFLGSWNFAVNLASPFFVVYMLTRLQLSMSIIISLSVVSQILNVLFFRLWGSLSDRFSNKSALAVAGPLFIVSILIWPFTTMPESYAFTIPLLILIHILAGISTAGVALCAGNIALKLAPKGKATSYLAANAIVSGLAATIAPIIGGIAASWFVYKGLTLSITWSSLKPIVRVFSLTPIDLRGLDFLFISAVLVGFYAIHRLLAVQEYGEVEKGIVITQFYAEVRKAVKNVSNIGGLRHLTYFPFAILERADTIGRRLTNRDNRRINF